MGNSAFHVGVGSFSLGLWKLAKQSHSRRYAYLHLYTDANQLGWFHLDYHWNPDRNCHFHCHKRKRIYFHAVF
jgi:hypothetical protein